MPVVGDNPYSQLMNKESSYLNQAFCWIPGVSKEVKCNFSMQTAFEILRVLLAGSCKYTGLAVCALLFYFFPAVHSRWLFALIQLSIYSDFKYLHSHVKAGKSHNKRARFQKPRAWLHNRNWRQIHFPQAALSGLSMLRPYVRIIESRKFLSKQLRIDSFHLGKWNDKTIGCYQRKFLDQVIIWKPCRFLYFFFFLLRSPMRQITNLSLPWKEILDKAELEQHKRSSCFCSLVFPRRWQLLKPLVNVVTQNSLHNQSAPEVFGTIF